MRRCAGLLAIVLGLASASAEARPAGFATIAPLDLDELYAKRMRFHRGVPRISVGVMDGQRRVTLGADTPLRMMFDEVDIPKVLYGPEGSRYELRVLSSKPADIRYWVVVHTRRVSEGPASAARLTRWAKLGLPVRQFEVGTINALGGTVLDTRELHVGVGGFAPLRAAERLLGALTASGPNPEERFIHEELVAPPSGTIGIYSPSGKLQHRAAGSVYVGTVTGGSVSVDAVEYGRGYSWHGREGRRFRDHIYVTIDRRGRLAVVNSISAEKLLSGLVPAEIFATAPLEALKAQAVTARGEIFSKIAHRHLGDPYHLCSEQHCQVYSGLGIEQPSTNRAVTETRGLLAVRPRRTKRDPLVLVDSRYSSSCGGHSEANDIVWGTAASDSLRPRLDAVGRDPAMAAFATGLTDANIRAFLESYPPAACASSSFTKPGKYRWTRTFTATQAHGLVSHLGVGTPTALEVLGRGKGGRVTGLRVKGTGGEADVLRELPVRRLFGNLNSGMFVLDVKRRAGGAIESLAFTGGGWGHGVGMCQMGRKILRHYYNGAVVERVY